jgi:hypothetical protein
MQSRPEYEHPGYSQVQTWLPDDPGKVEEHQDQEGNCKEGEDSVHGLLSGIKEGTPAEYIGLF